VQPQRVAPGGFVPERIEPKGLPAFFDQRVRILHDEIDIGNPFESLLPNTLLHPCKSSRVAAELIPTTA